MSARRLFTALCLISSLYGVAQNASVPVYFCQKDGTARQVWFSAIDSAKFSQGSSVASFYMEEGMSKVDYSLSDCLDSLAFSAPEGKVSPFPASEEFDVAFDPSDDTSYNNVKEVRPTSETDPEYDDFLENFVSKSTITVTYSGSTATVKGSASGVDISVNGAHVTVTSDKGSMRFVLKGSSADGSFKITSEKKFRLDLSGVDLTNPHGSAINIQSGKSVYLVLTSDTKNALTDGPDYRYVTDEDQKGTLFSEGQLLVSGSGSLNIRSISAHGLCSDDYIRFRSNLGKITINAAVDGINTKERLVIYGGDVDITAGDDGMVARAGHICIMGGKISVKAVDNGVSATYSMDDTTYVRISGGLLKLATTGDKGHGISCSGKMTIDGGISQITVAGGAAKAINCYGDMLIADTKLTLFTKGDPQYNDEEADYSSAACMRCRGNIGAVNSTFGFKSTGKGGKGFNCDGNIKMEGCRATVLTTGSLFNTEGVSVRPRAMECAAFSMGSGSVVNLCSSHSALCTTGDFNLSGGGIYAFSSDDSVKIADIRGVMSLTGGVFFQSR